jgi:hypothetical protein
MDTFYQNTNGGTFHSKNEFVIFRIDYENVGDYFSFKTSVGA